MADFEMLTDDILAALPPSVFEALVQTEDERPGSMLGVFEPSSNRNSRVFRVSASEYPGLLSYYLGGATLDDNGRIVRHQPVRDPVHRNHFAVRAEVHAIGQRGATYSPLNTPLITAQLPAEVWLTIGFETLHYDVGVLANDPDDPMRELSYAANEQRRYAIRDISAAREAYTALPGQFVWANSSGNPDVNNSIQAPIPVVVSYNDIRITLISWPYDAIPLTALSDCLGKVNSSTLELPSRPGPTTVDPETTLLQSYTITDGYFADGTRSATITLFLKYRDVGWNVFPAPDGSGFRRVFRKATQGLTSTGWQSIYQKANLNNGGHTLDDYARLFQSEET